MYIILRKNPSMTTDYFLDGRRRFPRAPRDHFCSKRSFTIASRCARIRPSRRTVQSLITNSLGQYSGERKSWTSRTARMPLKAGAPARSARRRSLQGSAELLRAERANAARRTTGVVADSGQSVAGSGAALRRGCRARPPPDPATRSDICKWRKR